MKTYPPFWLLAVVLFSGCIASTQYIEIDRVVPPFFHAKNVYVDPKRYQAMPHKVLILPCTGRAHVATLRDLDGLLIQELTKVNLFEVVPPLEEKAKSRRSSQEFSMTEVQVWAEQVGADGIMVCHVSSIQPYRPLLLGTSLKLWSIPKQAAVWAVDETFDSQLTTIANGARNYYLSNFRVSYPNRRSDQILESPNMFFQYAFAELFSTLPSKDSQPK